MATTFKSTEDALVAAWSPLKESTLLLEEILELGKSPSQLASHERIPTYEVGGCLAKTWIVPVFKGAKLFLRTESEARISHGLSLLLVRLFSGQEAEQVAKAEVTFHKRIGLDRLISLQRRNGLESMIANIQDCAKAYLKSDNHDQLKSL